MPRKGSKEALQLEVEKLRDANRKLIAAACPPNEAAQKLGPCPEDTLGGQNWAFRRLAIDMMEVDQDISLDPADKRAERRAISDAMVRQVPHSRRFEAEQTIKGDRAELERTKAKGPKLVPVPAAKKKTRKRKEKKAPRARRDAGAQLVPAPKP